MDIYLLQTIITTNIFYNDDYYCLYKFYKLI